MLFLTPDISFLGYLSSPRIGALSYNLVHSYIGPLTLLAASFSVPRLAAFAIIWLSHIAIDRLLGYGLKYATAFSDTHLGTIGRAPRN